VSPTVAANDGAVETDDAVVSPSYCLRRRERGIYLERSTTLSLLEWPVDDPLSNVERP
jgi:hypothetical protein